MKKLILAFLVLTPMAFAKDYAELTQTLVDLRGEVEALNQEFQLEKNDREQKLKNQGLFIADLETQIKREQTKIEQAQLKKKELEEFISLNSNSNQEFKSLVLKMGEELSEKVVEPIPFMRDKRREALAQIKERYLQGRLNEKQALSQYWQFVEDELRLSKENGLFLQTDMIEGELHRLEIAKLGSFVFYFKTTDGRVGKLTQKEPVFYTDSTYQKVVHDLFDSLKMQMRTGLYQIPIPAFEVQL